MHRSVSLLIALVALVSVAPASGVIASERVLRPQQLRQSGEVDVEYFGYVGCGFGTLRFDDACSFEVYTVKEVNDRLETLKKEASTREELLQKQVKLLNENVASLSDANSALTKRLNDLEKRMSGK